MQFNQTNNNSGDVNNAVSGSGNVVQSVGDDNKVQVDQPKKNFWGALWEKIKAGWKVLVG
jgi:hypothetical protein